MSARRMVGVGRMIAVVTMITAIARSETASRSMSDTQDVAKCIEGLRETPLLSETMTDGAESNMKETISAEITTVENAERMAASALQQLGFRVLRADKTLSVEGTEALWHSVFGVSFETAKSAPILGIPGSEKSYRKVIPGTMHVPENLNSLVKDVSFTEPPQFY